MPFIATNQARRTDDIVAVALNGGKVTLAFRSALFDAANRAGMSVNEFVLLAAAARLKASGYSFPSVFSTSDVRVEGEAA